MYYIYLLLATFFWGINFHLGKYMLTECNFVVGGFWRYFFAFISLWIFAFGELSSKAQLFQNIKGVFLVGVVGLFLFNILFFWGLQNTGPVNAALIISLNPLTTLILSNIVLGSKLTTYKITGILIGLTGAVWLISKGDLNMLVNLSFSKGDLIMLMANITFAMHHVLVKKYGSNLPGKAFTFLSAAMCFAGFAVLISFQPSQMIFEHSFGFWLSAIGIGCLGTALAYYIWNIGIQKVGASQAGVFMNMVPLSAAFTGLFLGASLFSYHLISGIVIVMGVIISQIPDSKK